MNPTMLISIVDGRCYCTQVTFTDTQIGLADSEEQEWFHQQV